MLLILFCIERGIVVVKFLKLAVDKKFQKYFYSGDTWMILGV